MTTRQQAGDPTPDPVPGSGEEGTVRPLPEEGRTNRAGQERRTRVPWRAIALGLALLPVNAFWLVHMEMATNQGRGTGGTSGPYPTTFSLFANAVSWLLLLTMLNALVRRLSPAKAFTQAELLITYIMLTIGTCIASVDFLDVLFPMIGHPAYYANAANNWHDLFVKHLPTWFYVTDKEAVKGWYLGGSNPYTWPHLRAWLVPLAAWGSFILVLLTTMLCINILLRKQWTQHERLSYPIIQLPLDMTDPASGFFSQRLVWAGCAVAAGISLLNGVSTLVPSVPSLPVKIFDISPNLPNPPWNAIGWTPVSLYPFAIGLGFLLPTDLLFSCWFFYFVWKAELVASSYFGWSNYTQSFPYVNEQCFGGYMGIALLALWGLRGHLSGVLRQAWRREAGADHPLQYRYALLGVFFGMAFLVTFFHMAGLSLWICVAAFVIYFAIALACTRMRAELGPPAHDLHNGGPDYILVAALGARAFSTQELSVLSYFYWFNRAYRSISMPFQLEAFKIGERKSISAGGITLAIVFATVMGLFSGCWALYHFGYSYGVEARMAPHLFYFGCEPFNRLTSWIQSPRYTDVPAMLAIALGFIATIGLQLMRMRFSGWLLHPLGLVVSGSYSMNTIWLPLVIAWICKVSVLHYGGMKSFRRARGFFLGLILGDYVLGCLWPIVGHLLGVNAYSFQQ